MNENKSLVMMFAEWWDTRKRQQPKSTVATHRNRWLPTPGNVIFTFLVIGGLLLAQNSGALTLFAAPDFQSASTGTIAYQGRLADTAGTLLTNSFSMIFRLYSASAGGDHLWEETWTGPNSVRVSDGLFNVMLGSLTPIPQAVITGNENLFLGITVGNDDEMAPRVQLGTVPFATQALTVPDGSITAEKLAPDAIQVLTASQTSGADWSVPVCNQVGTKDSLIPGMSLEFSTERPKTVLVDVSGLGHNSEPGKAIYSSIFVNGEVVASANGVGNLAGCRNSEADASTRTYCNLTNSATVEVEPGNHKIETWIDCDGAGTVKVFNSAMRALLLPR
ncbi:MAG: hypothetical protein AAF702_25240 [Chloroflexota bacterium]